jgi:putative peptidoglycan lipid II flippase
MSQMLKSSGAMGAATLASRLLGMVREMVYARFMGDGWVASAFVLALTIPSLFRRLLGEGALTAAFIPIFKDKEKNAGEAEMWKAANAVICGLVVAGAVISGLGMYGVSIVLLYDFTSGETRLMLELLRVMFPYMLLACLAAIFMGMLNARGRFFVPALGALVMNVVMIASALFLAPRMGISLQTQIYGLAIGILVAGAAQAAFQIPSLRNQGFRFAWVSPWRDPVVREVVQKMIPGAIGVAAFQLNVVITQGVAFWVDKEIVASFNYAVRLMELPQGVFGISLATYMLPTLAGLVAEKKFDTFRSTLHQGLGYLWFINLLASVLLLVLAAPIIRLLFERGAFTSESTDRAAFALACLAPGLVAFSTVNILARAFYALGDTRTPMRVSVFCLGLNAMLAIPLVLSFKQGGLGIANTLSALVNVGLLFYALRRSLKTFELGQLKSLGLAMLSAAVAAGAVAWITLFFWEKYMGHYGLLLKIGAVFVPALAATAVYWGVSLLAKVPQARARNLTGVA